MTTNAPDLAALKAAIDVAQAALADYAAQTAPAAPSLSETVVVATPRGKEIPPRDIALPKLAPGTARERARADYARRHPRRAAS